MQSLFVCCFFPHADESKVLTKNREPLGDSLHHNLVLARVGHLTLEHRPLVDGDLRDERQRRDQLLDAAPRRVQGALRVQLVVTRFSTGGQQRAFLRSWRGEREAAGQMDAA